MSQYGNCMRTKSHHRHIERPYANLDLEFSLVTLRTGANVRRNLNFLLFRPFSHSSNLGLVAESNHLGKNCEVLHAERASKPPVPKVAGSETGIVLL